MVLIRLVYVSTVSSSFVPADIEKILITARKNNAEACVTGMLCFNRKFFLQCLEGSRSKVNELYHKILKDSRHMNLMILQYTEITERDFSDWSMEYVPESSMMLPINIRYSASREFNPYNMSGGSAYKMMLTFKDAVPLV